MEKTTWDAITAISTAAAAVFTAVMAWFTRKAILEGQRQRQEANDHFAKTREQDKQHHEDGFRPLLVLGPSDGNESIDRQNVLTVMPSGFGIFADCVVRNIGAGPALNIRLSVRGEGREGFGPDSELSPLAAGDTFKGRDGHIKIGPIYTGTINRTDMQNLPNGLWLLVLEYEDVFGNPFYTVHTKERGKPWTNVGRGKPRSAIPPVIYTAEAVTQLGWARVKVEPTNQASVPYSVATFHLVQGAFKIRYPSGQEHSVRDGQHSTFISGLKNAGYDVLCDGPGEGPPTC